MGAGLCSLYQKIHYTKDQGSLYQDFECTMCV